MRAQPVRSALCRLGSENPAPMTEIDAAPIIASDGQDLVAVRARAVD
jgi:hypothetical protein